MCVEVATWLFIVNAVCSCRPAFVRLETPQRTLELSLAYIVLCVFGSFGGSQANIRCLWSDTEASNRIEGQV